MKKPKLAMDYNNTMGGVDKVDQRLQDYPLTRKRRKRYYKKIFFHIVDFALWNSYLLYLKSGGEATALKYRLQVIDETIKKYHTPMMSSKVGRPSSVPHPLRLTERHFPDVVPPTEKKSNPTRQCVVCSRKRDASGKRLRKESRYCCLVCDVALCVTPCFRIYHTKNNF